MKDFKVTFTDLQGAVKCAFLMCAKNLKEAKKEAELKLFFWCGAQHIPTEGYIINVSKFNYWNDTF